MRIFLAEDEQDLNAIIVRPFYWPFPFISECIHLCHGPAVPILHSFHVFFKGTFLGFYGLSLSVCVSLGVTLQFHPATNQPATIHSSNSCSVYTPALHSNLC